MVALTGPYVVIEGPRQSGRTTLARAIAGRTGAVIDRQPWPMALHEDFLDVLHRHHRGSVVLDGFHLSDHLLTENLDAFGLWQITGGLLARDALFVLVRPAGERDPRWEGAAQALREAGVPVVVYDRSEAGSYSRTLRLAEAWVRSREGRPRLFGDRVPGLGNLRDPRVVYVGEQAPHVPRLRQRAKRRGWDPDRYVRLHARFSRSARGIFDSDSGRYLWRALGDGVGRYAIVNAVQLDGTRLRNHLDREVLERQPDARWVALGRIAAEELRACGLVAEEAPHPQYWRRFHHHRIAEYARRLRGEE